MTTPSITDEQLRAYLDEALDTETSARVEQTLRDDPQLTTRLRALLSERDQGGATLGELWRRARLSCPSRTVWVEYVEGRLGDAWAEYLRFHLETTGCRWCAANLDDLRESTDARDISRRRQKVFASSIGQYRQLDDHSAVGDTP